MALRIRYIFRVRWFDQHIRLADPLPDPSAKKLIKRAPFALPVTPGLDSADQSNYRNPCNFDQPLAVSAEIIDLTEFFDPPRGNKHIKAIKDYHVSRLDGWEVERVFLKVGESVTLKVNPIAEVDFENVQMMMNDGKDSIKGNIDKAGNSIAAIAKEGAFGDPLFHSLKNDSRLTRRCSTAYQSKAFFKDDRFDERFPLGICVFIVFHLKGFSTPCKESRRL